MSDPEPSPSAIGTRSFARLGLALLALLLVGLGSRGLNEPDEGRYTNIAENFLSPGADIWEPVMSGFGHYDKPPLVYWVTALSLRVFGANEWAARAPSLFGACLTLLGLGWAAYRWRGREAAFWSTLICASMGQFWLLARFLTPDMFMTGLVTAGIAAWAECRHRAGHPGFWLLALFCWSAAWWAKATPCLVPLAGLALGLWLTGDREGLRTLRPGRLLAGILVLGCPWYLVMMARHPELKAFFFGRELMGRITGHVEGRRGPVYYHLVVGLLGWLPWWPLAAGTIWRRLARSGQGWRACLAAGGPEMWILATGFMVFSSISSKLPTYTLPLCPWAALLVARALISSRRNLAGAAFKTRVALAISAALILYASATAMAPGREASFGLNSSMRPVAKALKERGAAAVCFDRHWPGAEFYLGPRVYYVLVDTIQQRPDDKGEAGPLGKSHFIRAEDWRQASSRIEGSTVWAARYKKLRSSPFDLDATNAVASEQVTVGDFLLFRVR